MLTDFPAAPILGYCCHYELQQRKPTVAGATELERMYRAWVKSKGGDTAELVEIAIGSGTLSESPGATKKHSGIISILDVPPSGEDNDRGAVDTLLTGVSSLSASRTPVYS